MVKKAPSKTGKPAAKKTAAPKKAAAKSAAKKTASPKKEAPVKKPAAKKTAVKERPVTKKSPNEKRPVKTTNDGMDIALLLAQGMAEKKAENIRIMDMREVVGASSDYLVISHAASDKQVEAIADSAEEELFKATKERPWHREGYENLEWVLLDYINVVAHVFQQEKRDFYGVEELWGDAKIVPFKAK